MEETQVESSSLTITRRRLDSISCHNNTNRIRCNHRWWIFTRYLSQMGFQRSIHHLTARNVLDRVMSIPETTGKLAPSASKTYPTFTYVGSVRIQAWNWMMGACVTVPLVLLREYFESFSFYSYYFINLANCISITLEISN